MTGKREDDRLYVQWSSRQMDLMERRMANLEKSVDLQIRTNILLIVALVASALTAGGLLLHMDATDFLSRITVALERIAEAS